MKFSFVISQEIRLPWDIFLSAVLICCAFEIPYDILVGWNNKGIGTFFYIFFTICFLVDMILNCMTSHYEIYSGFWGWRNIAGLFNIKFSPEYQRETDSTVDEFLDSQPRVAFSYMRSGWFLIDFLSVFPFNSLVGQGAIFPIFRTLRLFRLGRILRLLRLIRLLKTLKLYDYINKYFSSRPAIGRAILLFISVTWLAHIHACLFYYFEKDVYTTLTYKQSLFSVYLAFVSASHAETLTTLGFIISISSVIMGMLFFGLLVGNFSSFFAEIDYETKVLDDVVKQWNSVFCMFPAVFDSCLRSKIIQYEKEKILNKARIVDCSNMVKSLDYSMEKLVIDKIAHLNKTTPTPEREALLKELLNTYIKE